MSGPFQPHQVTSCPVVRLFLPAILLSALLVHRLLPYILQCILGPFHSSCAYLKALVEVHCSTCSPIIQYQHLLQALPSYQNQAVPAYQRPLAAFLKADLKASY